MMSANKHGKGIHEYQRLFWLRREFTFTISKLNEILSDERHCFGYSFKGQMLRHIRTGGTLVNDAARNSVSSRKEKAVTAQTHDTHQLRTHEVWKPLKATVPRGRDALLHLDVVRGCFDMEEGSKGLDGEFGDRV